MNPYSLYIHYASLATDPLFGKILNIITNENYLREKWFNFGYELGLTVFELGDIEIRYRDPLRCTRKVLLQWRLHNKGASCEPITKALREVGLTDLAEDVQLNSVILQNPQISGLCKCYRKNQKNGNMYLFV